MAATCSSCFSSVLRRKTCVNPNLWYISDEKCESIEALVVPRHTIHAAISANVPTMMQCNNIVGAKKQVIAFTSSGAARCLEVLQDFGANVTATSPLDFSLIPCCYSHTLQDKKQRGRREGLRSRFQGVQGGSEQQREGRSHVSYPSYTPIGPPIPVKFSDCRNNFACGHVAQSLDFYCRNTCTK